ncbi:hypothetical protein CDD83_8750 [Cordyceps sp. RAO-2017]|nr:hypothetical protein CDD83_8750 [Cordyceps sp. RAO-2017]
MGGRARPRAPAGYHVHRHGRRYPPLSDLTGTSGAATPRAPGHVDAKPARRGPGGQEEKGTRGRWGKAGGGRAGGPQGQRPSAEPGNALCNLSRAGTWPWELAGWTLAAERWQAWPGQVPWLSAGARCLGPSRPRRSSARQATQLHDRAASASLQHSPPRLIPLQPDQRHRLGRRRRRDDDDDDDDDDGDDDGGDDDDDDGDRGHCHDHGRP